ncbi:DUF411 domain-containing protein [Acuticoccus sp. I52.16.1]|uniref:DUF411 domain-containing protein n=1 Tax=Acuticoccus sp. I52.16.1 TaxID=2928472 RepID=UPI001FD542CC|nr:DUF411 domain-containing protein [Acuticoccus sp. I52.16.1]UOM37025.1 metal-binding protein [Acuticoccus sp. I52.16.1]
MKKTFAIASLAGLALAGAAAFTTFSSAQSTDQPIAASAEPSKEITIWRDPGCGCCDAYAEYLEANGYRVTRVDDRDFDRRSVEAGVPAQGLGCHLAEIDGYYVSGLVPAEIIERLVTERPDIDGITLPGMPANAPGMAAEKTGTLKTYAFGDDGVAVYSDE